MKVFTTLFAALLVAQGAFSAITISNLELFSSVDEDAKAFLDCTTGRTATLKFDIGNKVEGDGIPEQLIEKIEISIDDMMPMAAIYDVANIAGGGEVEFNDPLESGINEMIVEPNENGDEFTVSLIYKTPKVKMEGEYKIRVTSTDTEELIETDSEPKSVPAIKYCTGDTDLDVAIDEDTCTITATHAGCDDYIYHDPEEACVQLVQNYDSNTGLVASMPMDKMMEENDGTFTYTLNKTNNQNVYTVSDASPKKMRINYSFKHGEETNVFETSAINAFNTVGCANWKNFCTGNGPTPPGTPALDSSLTCTLVNEIVEKTLCRTEVRPKDEKTAAKVTFSCPNSCTMRSGESTVTNKVMECPFDAREWQKSNEGQVAVNVWPTCDCDSAAGIAQVSTLLAVVMVLLSKLL